jgi:hypothetical protein
VTGGWGEPDGGRTSPPSEIRLRNGAKLKLNPEQWRALLKRPDVAEAVAKRAQGACDTANALAVTEGAVYEVSRHDDGTCSVHPGGEDPIKGIVDDAHHSTLLKTQAQHLDE